jgi:hypothetical protein
MDGQSGKKGTPREQLLERLLCFERALLEFVPERAVQKPETMTAKLRLAAEELRQYLATHVAPPEVMEWRELPDSDADITAFAYELQIEHQEILQSLAELLNMIEEMQTSMDRHETATRIRDRGRSLSSRIARHTAGEETLFGKLS